MERVRHLLRDADGLGWDSDDELQWHDELGTRKVEIENRRRIPGGNIYAKKSLPQRSRGYRSGRGVGLISTLSAKAVSDARLLRCSDVLSGGNDEHRLTYNEERELLQTRKVELVLDNMVTRVYVEKK